MAVADVGGGKELRGGGGMRAQLGVRSTRPSHSQQPQCGLWLVRAAVCCLPGWLAVARAGRRWMRWQAAAWSEMSKRDHAGTPNAVAMESGRRSRQAHQLPSPSPRIVPCHAHVGLWRVVHGADGGEDERVGWGLAMTMHPSARGSTPPHSTPGPPAALAPPLGARAAMARHHAPHNIPWVHPFRRHP
jgi:hypothetical protein